MISRQIQVVNKQRNKYAEQSSIKLSLECIQFTNPRISKKSGAENLRIVLNIWEITQVNDLSKPLLVQNSLTPFSKDFFFCKSFEWRLDISRGICCSLNEFVHYRNFEIFETLSKYLQINRKQSLSKVVTLDILCFLLI